MIATTEHNTKLDLTKEGQVIYDEMAPQMKHACQFALNCKLDGHDSIADAFNQAASEDIHERENAYEWLNHFTDVYLRAVTIDWRQRQFSKLMSDIKQRQKSRRDKSTNYNYNEHSKRSNKESERNSQTITSKAEGMGKE